jgi:hypothetical protein
MSPRLFPRIAAGAAVIGPAAAERRRIRRNLWLFAHQWIDITGAVDHAHDLDGVVDQSIEDDVVARQSVSPLLDCPAQYSREFRRDLRLRSGDSAAS